MSIVLTIIGISLLIILHELGHFAVARLFDMRVLRFSLGFGPTLWQQRFGETTYQVAAVPLGGYVLIDGMGPAEESDAPKGSQSVAEQPATSPAASQVDDDPRSYRNKPAWQRALVIFAGPAANWVVCAALLMGLAATVGFTQYDESQPVLGELVEEGPGFKAGLRDGDKVVKIGDEAMRDWQHIVTTVRANPGRELTFNVERQGNPGIFVVTPADGPGGVGIIQAMPHASVEQVGAGGAFVAGVKGAWRLTVDQAKVLGGVFTGKSGGQLSGLPGIVKVVSKQAERSLQKLFESLAYLSIGLCLLNLLPVPALDGSRLAFLGVELVRRKPLDERIEGILHTAGFVLLFGVMIFVSVRDLL